MFKNILYRRLPGKRLIAFMAVALVAYGCSSTKTVPEGDALFAGFKVKVNNEKDSSQRQKQVTTELTANVRPKPNASILGLRPKLWIYNAFYTEKQRGIGHWIGTKLGEPPVLLSEVDTSSINEVMSGRLHNRGYFNNTVRSTTTSQKKKATIEWNAFIGEPYRIRKVAYTPSDSVAIQKVIRDTKAGSLLVPGEPYDLPKMTQERMRIDENLKNKGYYFFRPDILIFSVDTTVGNREADVLLRLKNTATPQELRPYTLDNIFIHADYFLNDSLSTSDTLRVREYHYIPNEHYVKARHLLNGVFLHHDSLYTRQNHLLTTRRLSGLSAYKFVNVQYEPDTTQQNKLDAFIFLTPALKKGLQIEAQMVNKTNNFAGPGATVSFRNRNAFKGSESLSVDFTGNLESQVGGRGNPPEGASDDARSNPNLTSFELGVQTRLSIPRILSPFNLTNLRTEFVPKTRITAGFNFLNRVNYFQMNSFNASYAYNWRPQQTITHDITPVNFQYVSLINPSELFDSLLTRNQFLRRSFENQFIIGSIYEHTFSTQMFEDRTHRFSNNFTVDVSGNLINALQSLTGAEKGTPDEPRTLAGQPFSQYIRFENNFRYYFALTENTMLATRFLAGVGYSYGNSTTLPYVKQFSIGGPNSIRAFRARSIGPGSYNVPDSLFFSFFDQTGDMKLEANVEYRFPIFGFFKGALFVDAGNIWLLRDTFDENGEVEKPGGRFRASNFMNQLAVGTGFGIRVDVEFFVIRFDFGIPVHVPYLPRGERNVLSDYKFGFKGDNSMTLNIAIGYPF